MRNATKGFVLTVLACINVLPTSAYAEDAGTVAARFGALEELTHASLSPDAAYVAFVSPSSTSTKVFVADLAKGGAPRQVMAISAKEGFIDSCSWASAGRVVCLARYIVNNAGQLLGFTRQFAVNADGSALAEISARDSFNARGLMQNGGSIIDFDVAESPGTILMTHDYRAEDRIGSLLGSNVAGRAVDMVDTITLKRKKVEPPRLDASSYISDGHGQVRIMGTEVSDNSGILKGISKYYYRKVGSREWNQLSTVKFDGVSLSGFDPYAVDSSKNVAYGFETRDGFAVLSSVALDGSLGTQVVLSRPGVDVDGLVRIGRERRVVGGSYATDRRQTEYFDLALKKLMSALSNALPGKPGVDVIGASDGERKLLLIASSDTNPGMTYLFDKTSGTLEELLPVRPALTGKALAEMKPITYKASDGTDVPAYLTLPLGSAGKNLPAIVMPHGGPSSRDEWGFDWLVQFFAARGFAVLQPNYRGSAGYGSAWFQSNGFQSWKTAIGDVNDAGRWLQAQGIAAPGKLAIFGWSYGGYAALQSSALDPDLYKAIVAVAPVTDLDMLKQEADGFTNSALVNRMIGSGPHVREGSPTQNVSLIKAPVLLFHGTRDQNVGVGESRAMSAKLKSAGKTVQYVEFDGLDHQLISSEARTQMLRESDSFIRKALGLPEN